MGFLFHAIKVPTAITGAFILSLWSHLKLLAIGTLTHLGLYKQPPPEEDDSGNNSDNYIFILDGTCPSLVPIPIHVVTAAIKTKVPILRYEDFLSTIPEGEGGEEEQVISPSAPDLQRENKKTWCTICLEPIDLKHEVRKLCRCTHVFHRDCLDTWVDSGQVTCPLCRSMLLPPKTNLSMSCGGGGVTGEDPPPTTTTTTTTTTVVEAAEGNANTS